MALLDVLVPQMGEGLQEVVVVGFHKKPGDTIRRDEILYSMETDKAVMEVESPYQGVLVEWLAEPGSVLPIGTPIARIESDSGQPAPQKTDPAKAATPQAAVPSANVTPRNLELVVPPRTRALCKEKGISEEEMRSIPSATGKLMPADVEAYLANRKSLAGLEAKSHQPAPAAQVQQNAAETGPEALLESGEAVELAESSGSAEFFEQPLTQQQRVFTSRIRRSSALVIPATMTRPIIWKPVTECTRTQREADFTFRPTEFQTVAWCVSRATQAHPKFRSTLQGDESVREYTHVNLGIAVSRKNGELVTAVVRNADTLDFRDFVHEIQAAIGKAREGADQADSATQLHLTYMGAYGITEGVPVLVSPAIGVLFVGAPFRREGETWANLTLTFDHRLINGVEGAEFLKAIAQNIEKLDEAV